MSAPKVHRFRSTGEAYDNSQTGYYPDDFDWAVDEAAWEACKVATAEYGEGSDEATAAFRAWDGLRTTVADGDVLVVENEKAVAVMVEAWPVAISGEFAGENFHRADGTWNWARVERTAKTGTFRNYSESAALAEAEAAKLHSRGVTG